MSQPPQPAELRAKRHPRPPLTQAQSRSRASWIFVSLLVALFSLYLAFGPTALPPFKQRILTVIIALLVGLFGFFLTGDLGFSIRGGKTQVGQLRLKATNGAGLFAFTLVMLLLIPIKESLNLRVVVLGPDGLPVEDAAAWTSVGGEPKKVAGGWEFEIPPDKWPKDGTIAVYAVKPSAFLRGTQEVKIGDDLQASTTVQLRVDSSAHVRGVVLDDGRRPLAGVIVSLANFPAESVTTGSDGSFILPAKAADGQEVRLNLQKKGYVSKDYYHMAGLEPAYMLLERTEDLSSTQ